MLIFWELLGDGWSCQFGLKFLGTAAQQHFPLEFYNWLFCKKPIRIDYSKTIPETLDYLLATREKIKNHRAVEIEKANQNSDFLVE